MVRIIGVLISLVVLSGTARADWWSVDIPSGWYGFSLPEAQAVLDRVRKAPGVKQVELRMYSATDTVLAIYLVTFNDAKDLKREDIEKYDHLIELSLTGGFGARQRESSSEWVDDQLISRQVDEGPAVTATTRRITAVGSGDRVHMLMVGCFATKGTAGTVCSRIQESAKVKLPDQVALPSKTSIGTILLIGVGGLLGLFALYAVFRPRASPAPGPTAASVPAPSYVSPVAARVPKRAESSIPLEGYVPAGDPGASGSMSLGPSGRTESLDLRPDTIPLETEPRRASPTNAPPMGQGDRAVRRTTPPAHNLRGRVRFAILSGELSQMGIEARREDGAPVLVLWSDVVGIVARRLPPDLDDVPFVDLVSRPGATLRVLPWTRVTGEPLREDGIARVREIVAMFRRHCPEAALDRATQAFMAGEPAAQLDGPTLAQHDDMLA